MFTASKSKNWPVFTAIKCGQVGRKAEVCGLVPDHERPSTQKVIIEREY